MGRMAASPFIFLRGSACVMAADLSKTPITGIPVIIDGDAHLNNFGFYGTPQREVVLFGNGDSDPLFLQVKEAAEPAHGPYLPQLPKEFLHNGKRVVL